MDNNFYFLIITRPGVGHTIAYTQNYVAEGDVVGVHYNGEYALHTVDEVLIVDLNREADRPVFDFLTALPNIEARKVTKVWHLDQGFAQ